MESHDETRIAKPLSQPERLSAISLRGVWAALLTPWTEDERFDRRKLIAEIDSFASAGVHGIYTGGTAGEFYAQDDVAFLEISRVVGRAAAEAGLRLQIGCTALSTKSVCLSTINCVNKAALKKLQGTSCFFNA